jgi:hypothetical protein
MHVSILWGRFAPTSAMLLCVESTSKRCRPLLAHVQRCAAEVEEHAKLDALTTEVELVPC